ncbi:MAG: hypothetical protein CVU97_05640, partial [Firmicutes bacterium HGW-Firmicutes-21]
MVNVTTVSKFGGLNQSCKLSEDITYSPDMVNFKITDNFSLKKRGGIKTVYNGQSNNIDGMWSGYIGSVFYMLFVSGGYLYSLDRNTGAGSLIGYVDTGRVVMFEISGKVYILNGNRYCYFDGGELGVVSGYVPLIAIGCSPSGAGSAYEDLNLLTPKRRQQFSSDGISANYTLLEKNINLINYITVNGVNFTNFTYNLSEGTVHFNTIPPQGINNVEICYTKNNLDRTRITKNRYAMLFGGNVDGRLFLWGHPDYLNYRFHSELAGGVPSVEYFPEHNFTVIGNTEITDIVPQYDRQLIFTKDRAFYSYCELRQDTLGKYYTSFPVYNLNGEKGNLIKGSCCIIDNEPITFCNDGLNRWSSTTVENEKNAVCISSPISSTIAEIVRLNALSSLRLFDFQTGSELIFYYNNRSYIYNYKLGVWYVYDDMYCDCFCDCLGVLYFSYGDKIYKLSECDNDDDDLGVTAHWKSPFFSAGQPYMRKDITELSVTIKTVANTTMDLAVNSDLNPNNIYEESFWITNTFGEKI